MTGYATRDLAFDGATLSVEAKSVNNRGLDVRLRLPSGLDRLDGPLRSLVRQRFERGSVQISVNFQSDASRDTLHIDEERLSQFLQLGARLAASQGFAPSTLEGMLALPGVVKVTAKSHDPDALDAAITGVFQATLEDLQAVRRSEGAAIAAALGVQLGRLTELGKTVAADPALSAKTIKMKLRDQVARLVEAGGTTLDPDRLHAEAAILATKADITEELDRIAMHLDAARHALQSGGAVGRKLDFIAQELNREANTICSKSQTASITARGLDMKIAIEQFREQIQNLE